MTGLHRLLAAAATVAATAAGAEEARIVTGEAAYRDRIALGPAATLSVELRDAAGVRVARADWATLGAQVLLGFALSAPAGGLSLRAALRDGDQGWIGEALPLAEDQAEAGLVALVATVPAALSTRLDCGVEQFDVSFPDDGMARLAQGATVLDLAAVPAASGARYAAGTEPETEVWLHGETALVTRAGADLPECRVVPPAARLTEGPWRIEDIAGRGVLDGVSSELSFGIDGRLSGTGGCNRLIGSFALEGDVLSVGPGATTMMACPEAVMGQERRVLSALAGDTAIAFDRTGALVILDGPFPVLTLRPADG